MPWSPSQPPKDRAFIVQDEFGNVGSGVFHPDLQEYVWVNTKITTEPKFWQDFPKPLLPRDPYGAKIKQGRI